jgi:hypothetical protein
VLLCFTGDQACLANARQVTGSAPIDSRQIGITQKSWGSLLPQRNYTVIVVPPRG